ncbi:MAG TPA: peptide chain release factor 3, partial [Nevskiaceae bacterium]|nr:peptide chain release factor 3 [Nevskiaceae bacterium]
QLCEEGATQVYRPLTSNDVVLGAVGVLQFDVVEYRLRDEYSVNASFEAAAIFTARWVRCENDARLADFREKNANRLALDHDGELVYLASSMVNLRMTQERWPGVQFLETREQRIHA